MANLIKNANLEIEKSKTISVRRDEALKKYDFGPGRKELDPIDKEIAATAGDPAKQKAIEDKIYLGLSENKNQLLERIYKEIDSETYLKDQIK